LVSDWSSDVCSSDLTSLAARTRLGLRSTASATACRRLSVAVGLGGDCCANAALASRSARPAATFIALHAITNFLRAIPRVVARLRQSLRAYEIGVRHRLNRG